MAIGAVGVVRKSRLEHPGNDEEAIGSNLRITGGVKVLMKKLSSASGSGINYLVHVTSVDGLFGGQSDRALGISSTAGDPF